MIASIPVITHEPSVSLSEHEQRFCENIEKYGFAITNVFEDASGPSFSYSTGFWQKFELPEVIIFGHSSDIAGQMLWNLFDELVTGRELKGGSESTEILDNHVCKFRVLLEEQRLLHLTWSDWYYCRKPFPSLQMFWPDAEGRFCWDTRVSEDFKWLQPNLSEV